jgi:hypothetical protein
MLDLGPIALALSFVEIVNQISRYAVPEMKPRVGN